MEIMTIMGNDVEDENGRVESSKKAFRGGWFP